MAKQKEKETALTLRAQGSGIKEIARTLHVSPATASYWCRDIVLTAPQQQALAARSKRASARGLLAYSELKRNARFLRIESAKQTGAKSVGELSKRDITMIGYGLYWGEGYKRGSEEFGFTNSDPDMLRFYCRWLRTVFNVDTSQLIVRISINSSHKNRDVELKRYWSRTLGLKNSQFTKTSFIKSTSRKQYTNHTEHFGTLRIKVRGGTGQRREVLGALEHIKQKID